MESLGRIISTLSIPLMLLNMFGGIVSGIWLAVLGHWGVIGYGILALFVSGMLLGLAMMPGLIFAAPAVAMLEKGNKFAGSIFGFLGTLYTLGVLSIWCIFVLVYHVKLADTSSIIPLLVWSYGIATSPIAWLAQKDLQSGNENAMVATFFIQISYLVAILAILFVGVSVLHVLVIFGVIMSIGLVTQFSLAYAVDSAAQRY